MEYGSQPIILGVKAGLSKVEAISANNVWAVGSFADGPSSAADPALGWFAVERREKY